jgi:hypothetical protein
MNTTRQALTVLVAASIVAAASAAAGAGGPIRVPLHAVNGSGQTGVAVLTPTAGGYTVAVRLSGKHIQAGEHDHIHNLSCARYGRIAPHPKDPTTRQVDQQLATISVGLNDIYHGRSTTTVGSPLSQVTKGGFSINVHEPGDPYTALACGDIPAGQG